MPSIYDALTGPDLGRIERGDPRATADAIFYLWKKLENEAKIRARDDRTQGNVGDPGSSGIRWDAGPWHLGPAGNNHHVAVIRPAQITANQNNYNPPGWETAIGMELETDAARTITGIKTFGRQRRISFLLNRGNFNITLPHNSSSSDAVNRFGFGSASENLVIPSGRIVWFQYDVGSEVWRLYSIPAIGWTNLPASLGSPVQLAELTLSTAQIDTLNATPVQIVAAPGAGIVRIPVWVAMRLTKSNGAWSAGPVFNLQYVGNNTDLTGGWVSNLNVVGTGPLVAINPVTTQTFSIGGGFDPTNVALEIVLGADTAPGAETASAVITLAYYDLDTN